MVKCIQYCHQIVPDAQIGWALTLLSQDCLSYASTCQTIGLNTGYFLSFTVFLAFNSEAFAYVQSLVCHFLLILFLFSHRWGLPQLTLAMYLRFWCVVYFLLTAWIAVFKKEV